MGQKLIFILIAAFLVTCSDQTGGLETYQISTIDNIGCKLTYENGILREINHYKKGSKDFALTNYIFNEDGTVSILEKIIGDSIVKNIYYFDNGNIKRVFYDKDLNPQDAVIIFDGSDTAYYEDGKFRYTGNWKVGEKQDTFKFYNCAGTLARIEIYSNGQIINETNFD